MIQLDDSELINLIKESSNLFGEEIQYYFRQSFSRITRNSTQDDVERALRRFPRVFSESKEVGIDFKALVKQLKESEELLTAISDFHRDHYFHQVRVALLGLYILRKGNLVELIKSNRKLFEEIGNDEKNCEFAWLYSSLFHDIGYPIEKIGEIENYVRKMIRSFPDIHFDIVSNIQYHFDYLQILKDIANFGGSLNDRTNNSASILREALIAYHQKDHGIMSSLIVYNNFKNEMRKPFLLPGLQGMAMHNLKEEQLGFKIKFDDFPFAYLLVLCDEIQEWGRATRAGLFLKRIVPIKTIGFELINNSSDHPGMSIKVLLRKEGRYTDWDKIFEKKYHSLQKLEVCKNINIKFAIENGLHEKPIIFTDNGEWKFDYAYKRRSQQKK